jgi:hypothetical protein
MSTSLLFFNPLPGLLTKTALDPASVDYLYYGTVIQESRTSNIAREVRFVCVCILCEIKGGSEEGAIFIREGRTEENRFGGWYSV